MQELGKLGEEPIAVLEELVLVNRVELVPILVGILLQVFLNFLKIN